MHRGLSRRVLEVTPPPPPLFGTGYAIGGNQNMLRTPSIKQIKLESPGPIALLRGLGNVTVMSRAGSGRLYFSSARNNERGRQGRLHDDGTSGMRSQQIDGRSETACRSTAIWQRWKSGIQAICLAAFFSFDDGATFYG